MRTLIFTMFIMAYIWITDFAVLMWNLDTTKAPSAEIPGIFWAMCLSVWIFGILLDVSDAVNKNK